MLRSLRIGMLLGLIGISGLVAARTSEDHPRVVVSVINNADVDVKALEQAEEVASRIYQQAGLSIVWNNCAIQTGAGRCIWSVDSHNLVLRIERQPRTLSNDAYGVAFLGADGNGAYCDVFYDRIVDLHRRGRASQAAILGIVAAHELGHLLLGSHAHSSAGVMRPQLAEREFSTPGFGLAVFNHQQAQRITGRLKQD